jgi:hypothetical protein
LQKELIFGVLSDWGGIATEFTKVFEVELNQALHAIVRSDKYRQFETARKEQRFLQAHPTSGSFLHLLREHAELPRSLQLKLQAASELHTDSSLLSRIERVVSEHRNPAAHVTGVTRCPIPDIDKKSGGRKLRPVPDGHSPRNQHRLYGCFAHPSSANVEREP